MRYMVALGGGLGDLLLDSLAPASPAGRIAATRVLDRDAFVRLVCCSTAPGAAELFSHSPLFDEVLSRRWGDDSPDYLRAQAAGFQAIPAAPWARPDIALDEDEQEQARAILAVGPFVALHTFAGTSDRDWRGKQIDTQAIISRLTFAGLGVVALGGGLRRSDGLAERASLHGALNLVGRASVRLQAWLVCRAVAFVGSFSAYHCAALACRAPSFVLAPRLLQPFFETPHPRYGTLAHRRGSSYGYFDALPADLPGAILEFVTSPMRKK